MRGLWVGPMPVQEFMDDFLPLSDINPMPKVPEDLIQSLPSTGDKTMPTKLIVQRAGLFPGLKLVDTSNHHDNNADDHKKIRPDMSAYLSKVATAKNVIRFEAEELMFELKPPSAPAHPFKDPKPTATTEQLTEHSFETNTDAGILCRGQIASYFTEWFSRQHRTHGFLVYVANDGMRFIRADRSGAIVSRSFDWRQEPQTFAEFLWRFAHLTPEQRGRDTTVRPATPREKGLAHLNLRPWEPKKERPIIVLQVPEDQGGFREVIAWGAMADADSLTGRATRAWPVYDLKLEKVVFLKDSWRSLVVGMEKESEILSDLNKAGVRNVPKLICGDDIDGHLTLTQKFISKPWNAGGTGITSRAQHRFLEDFVGKHLCHFTSSKQLMQAVYDAFIAHQDAYEKCGILHRDVSGNNVMMKDDGRGILNDWDQARRVADMASGPRQLFRSGTWHFMSVLLLENPDKLQDLQDDIESFVYVVLFHVLRYVNHTQVHKIHSIMEEIFDDCKLDDHGNFTGGRGKRSLLFDSGELGPDFAVVDNTPLQQWLLFAFEAAADWLSYATLRTRKYLRARGLRRTIMRQLYEGSSDSGVDQPQPDTADPSDATVHLIFHDHRRLGAIWQSILDKGNWPQDDGPVDNLSKSSLLKRTRNDDPFNLDVGSPLKKHRTTLSTPYATSAPAHAPLRNFVGGATVPAPPIPPRSSIRLSRKAARKSGLSLGGGC